MLALHHIRFKTCFIKMKLTFIVVEARIEARLSILDIRVSFCASFLLRYQRRHP